MMRRSVLFGLSCALSALLVVATYAQGTAFTYQGFLKQSGSPVNGSLDMTFRLYTALTGGTLLGTETRTGVPVQNGLFTVELDFGSVWDGSARYLEIEVGTTTLSPRVKINPTPYATYSNNTRGIQVDTNNNLGLQLRQLIGVNPADTFSVSGRLMGHYTLGWYDDPWNGSGATAWLSGYAGIKLFTAGTSRVVVTQWGNIGIGTDVPIATLDVMARSVGDGIRVRGVSSNAPGYMLFDGNNQRGVLGLALANGQWGADALPGDIVLRAETGRLLLQNGPGAVGLILSGNKVGIGTTNPLYPLDVRTSTASRAVSGNQTDTSGFTYGVWGQSASTSGTGVVGLATATSGLTYGGYGESVSTSGTGVAGWATASSGATYGVQGRSDSTAGRGVFGWAAATSGTTFGVQGRSDSTAGRGVYGWAVATSGTTFGVWGQSDSTSGTGVAGWATATSGATYGVHGRSYSTSGTGVVGWAVANSGPAFGVWGQSNSPDGRGVYGVAVATSGTTYGVFGQSDSPSGYGVYSVGRFAASGTKSFQMDHPLSPETHYLNHFCTEGPDPYNVYRGNVVTDARGYATITLPAYFESINRDPTYHLTVIDGAGEEFVQARVAQKIRNNQFVIRTSKPFVEVSWEVKAIRNDLWVQKYGYQTEPEKPQEHQGKYLNPELYGQPKEMGVHYHPEPERLEPNDTPKQH